MSDARVNAAEPPGQGLLGEFKPTKGVRLTLHRRESGIVLLRHRVNTYANAADIAAHVTCTDGVVTGTDWNDWHRKHQPVWMPTVEDWIRETVKASR